LQDDKDYDQQEFHLPAELMTGLRTFARQHQVTPNTLAQGAWAFLLSRYSGVDDVVFGVTSSGRPTELSGVEAMIGLFINTLPMRVAVSPQETVLVWLRQLQARQFEMRQYEYSPLVQVQGWSEVPRGLPLFESLIAFENYPVDRSFGEKTDSLEIRNVRLTERMNYPLVVGIGPGSGLMVKVHFHRSRFDADTVTRIVSQFHRILEAMIAAPERRLRELSLLSDAERYQSLIEWNNTTAEV